MYTMSSLFVINISWRKPCDRELHNLLHIVKSGVNKDWWMLLLQGKSKKTEILISIYQQLQWITNRCRIKMFSVYWPPLPAARGKRNRMWHILIVISKWESQTKTYFDILLFDTAANNLRFFLNPHLHFFQPNKNSRSIYSHDDAICE